MDKRLLAYLFTFFSYIIAGQNNAISVVGDPITVDTTKKTPEVDLYKSALKLQDSAKWKESMTPLKKAIKVNPEYVPASNKLGLAKFKLDDPGGAESDFLWSLKNDPNSFEALKYLGIIYYNAKRYEESKMYMDSAGNQRVDDPEFFYYRARLMFAGKEYKKALSLASYAIEENKKYTDAYLLKAEIRFAMKDYNYALKELNDAEKTIPADKPNYGLYKTRAKAKFEVQDYKGAVTDWNVYIDANPKEEEALISRAAAKINSRDFTGAIIDLDEAAKLSPKNPVIYNYRGLAKGENKQMVEGLKDLDYAIKLKFNYAPAYVNRAALRFASKDKRGACQDLEKADALGDQIAYKLIEQYCR